VNSVFNGQHVNVLRVEIIQVGCVRIAIPVSGRFLWNHHFEVVLKTIDG
jgi:hypothetical protein